MSGKSQEIKANSADLLQLGEFTFSLQANELKDKNGNDVHLRRQSSDTLAYLACRPGALVTKEELTDAIWKDLHVTDDSLVKCIADIRRALHDTDHKIVQTLPKKGYKLEATPVSAGRALHPDAGETSERGTPRRGGVVPVLAALAVAIVFGVGLLWWQSTAPDFEPVDPATMSAALPDKPSIAVLAFDDFSNGSDRGYLSDAVAEGIINGLSRFQELFVIARNSSFQFRETPTDIREIARTLGVRYLIEGSQQKIGNELRVTVQLIDALEGHHLWSEHFDRDLTDVFAVQDEVVRKVVATVAGKLIEIEGMEATKAKLSKLTALHHNLKGRPYLREFSPEGTEKARLENLRSIEADPDEPYGYIGLAYVHIFNFRYGWGELEREEALDQARVMAQKALDVAPDFYDSHATMGYVHVQTGELDLAITKFHYALSLNPNSTLVMGLLVEALGYDGRTAEAEELQKLAMRLDPLHPHWMEWNLAWLQWMNGKCDQALDTLQEMHRMPPLAYRMKAIVHICLGQTSEAEAAITALLEHHPGYSIAEVRKNFQGKYSDPADLERYLDSLRQAGLPEGT